MIMSSSIHPSIQQKIQQIWKLAQHHRSASIVGRAYDPKNYHTCLCCNQPTQKQPIPLCQHIKEFQVFGFGYPLWFSFLKYCILLVLILIVSKTSMEVYVATKENYLFCYGKHQEHGSEQLKQSSEGVHGQGHSVVHLRHINYFDIHESNKPKSIQSSLQISSSVVSHSTSHHQSCTSFMIYVSLFKGQQITQSIFLRCIQFLIHLLTLIGIRNMIIKQNQYYDQRTCSLSDYSLMLCNLPQIYGIKQKVKQFIQNGLLEGNQTVSIKDIIYIFKDEQVYKLENQKQKLQKEILEKQWEKKFQYLNQLNQKLKSTQNQLKELTYRIKQNIERDYIKCDKIIVIFNSQAQKGTVLENYRNIKQQGNDDFTKYFSLSSSKIHNKIKVEVKQAPQPNELIWEHIDQSDEKRKAKIFLGWFLTFVFLFIITVIFYGLMLAKTNLFLSALQMQTNDPSSSTAKSFKSFSTFIVFIAIFGVLLFNKFIMGKVLHYFVHLQKHAYTDKQNHSFALKYSLGMFFTTALMTLAVQAITFKNFYSHSYGVIQQQTIMFCLTAFFVPLIWLIHPYNLYKKIKYFMSKDKLVSQKDANQLVEYFPYDLGKRYAEVFEIMWFTFLYSSLIPIGSFLTLVGLGLYYWVDKYNFLRRSVLKAGLSGKMAIMGLKSLDATLFLAPAGNVLFSFILHDKIDKLEVIFVVLGVIYLILPISDWIEAVNEENFLIESKKYENMKNSFCQTYMTLHPMYQLTHKEQIQRHMKNVRNYQREQLKNVQIYATGRGSFQRKQSFRSQ